MPLFALALVAQSWMWGACDSGEGHPQKFAGRGKAFSLSPSGFHSEPSFINLAQLALELKDTCEEGEELLTDTCEPGEEPLPNLTKGQKNWCFSLNATFFKIRELNKGEKAKECKKKIKEEEDRCLRVYLQYKSSTDSYENYGFLTDFNCSEFRKKLKEVDGEEPTRRIAAAVKECEPAAIEVCNEYACPKYMLMRNWPMNATYCKEACVPDLHQEKKVEADALQKLVADQLFKCICVTRQDGDPDCGIPAGQLWCEVETTSPSWWKLVELANIDRSRRNLEPLEPLKPDPPCNKVKYPRATA